MSRILLAVSVMVLTAAQAPTSVTPAQKPPVRLGPATTPIGEPAQVQLWSFDSGIWVTDEENRPRQLTVGIAASLLADPNMASLWPTLLSITGPDLVGLRDRNLALARARTMRRNADPVPSGTSEAQASSRIRAILQYADALGDSGRAEEAVAVLHAARAPTPAATAEAQADYVALIAAEASQLRARDRNPDAALTLLRDGRRALVDSYAVNLDVNRAAMLATSGRYAEALTVVTQALADFNAAQGADDVEHVAVPGSLRHFAWIRACALQGLGRTEEARQTFSQVVASPDLRNSPFLPQSNRDLRLRARACMHDVEGLVDELVGQLDSGLPGQPVFRWLQPGFAGPELDPAIVAAVRANPRMVAVACGRVRLLPAEMQPGLNSWRLPRGVPR